MRSMQSQRVRHVWVTSFSFFFLHEFPWFQLSLKVNDPYMSIRILQKLKMQKLNPYPLSSLLFLSLWHHHSLNLKKQRIITLKLFSVKHRSLLSLYFVCLDFSQLVVIKKHKSGVKWPGTTFLNSFKSLGSHLPCLWNTDNKNIYFIILFWWYINAFFRL